MRRRIPRPAIWGAAAGATATALVLGLATWMLATDVGAPADPYDTPNPCNLVGEETVATLVGDVPGRRSEPYPPPGWRPLHRGMDSLQCTWETEPDAWQGGRLQLDVERHYSTQLRLGRTGTEWAKFMTDGQLSRCIEERPTSEGVVCIISREPSVMLKVRQANLIVDVWFTPDVDGWFTPGRSSTDREQPADPAALLADEVRSRLDERS